MTAEGKVALIRGRRFGYGDRFDCSQTESKNWIVIYDPVSKQEKTIFDRPLDYDLHESPLFCVFEQMQLSHDRSTLYLVSPVYATSGSLAIINLAQGSVIYVSGVDLVYVIAEISDEWFSVGGNDKVPLLRTYLSKIGGTITVNGKRLP